MSNFLYTKWIYDLDITPERILFLSVQLPNVEAYAKLRVGQLMEANVTGVRRLSRGKGLLRLLSANEHIAFAVFVKKVKGRKRTEEATMAGLETTAKEEDGMGPRNFNTQSKTPVMKVGLTDERAEIESEIASKIVTANSFGMQVTTFDEGSPKLLYLKERDKMLRHLPAAMLSASNGRGCDTRRDSAKR